MTAKEKAIELIEKYQSEKIITYQRSAFSPIEEYELTDNEAKYCALIAVEEILDLDLFTHKLNYWQEVKQEINKL